MDSKAKGDALETAVRGIESAILRSFPGYSERSFRIETKKTVSIAGVRHEIDIFVTVALGAGYDSIFIFECKNWQDKVSKNEIIVFAEKIRAVEAQRGFFVAKSYTGDAEAQGAMTDRLEILRATELDPSAVTIPGEYHNLEVGLPRDMRLDIIMVTATPESQCRSIDLLRADFQLAGNSADLRAFITSWLHQLRDEQTASFPSLRAGLGTHRILLKGEMSFADRPAVVNGQTVGLMRLTANVDVHVVKPVIISAFDVETRGRSITVASDLSIGQLVTQLVQLSPASGGAEL